MKQIKFILLLLILIPTLILSAEIYQVTDALTGEMTYSDTPVVNSEVVTVPESATYTPNLTSTAQTKSESVQLKATAPAAPSIPSANKVITVLSPKDQENIHNVRELPVKVNVVPPLVKGERVQIYVDGAPSGAPLERTDFIVRDLSRGTHQVYAALLDTEGAQINMSSNVVFYVHYDNLGPLSLGPRTVPLQPEGKPATLPEDVFVPLTDFVTG